MREWVKWVIIDSPKEVCDFSRMIYVKMLRLIVSVVASFGLNECGDVKMMFSSNLDEGFDVYAIDVDCV